MATRSWIDDEPGLDEMLSETACILERARRRIVLVFVLAITAAIALGLARGRMPRKFRSQAVVKVHDVTLQAGTHPITAKELETELESLLFTRASLLKLMTEFKLYKGAPANALTEGVAQVRDRLELNVVQDAVLGHEGALIGTTHLTISFADEQPETALQVVRRVTEVITETAGTTRQRQAEEVLTSLRELEQQLETQLNQVSREQLLAARDGLNRDPATALMGDLDQRSLEGTAKQLESQLEQVRKQSLSMSIDNESNERDLGINFEVVDPGHLPPAALLSKSEEMVLAGALAFVLLLPAFAVFLGVSDTRVRDARGLRRVGMAAFGQVPAFSGHELGSLSLRLKGAQERLNVGS